MAQTTTDWGKEDRAYHAKRVQCQESTFVRMASQSIQGCTLKSHESMPDHACPCMLACHSQRSSGIDSHSSDCWPGNFTLTTGIAGTLQEMAILPEPHPDALGHKHKVSVHVHHNLLGPGQLLVVYMSALKHVDFPSMIILK